MKKQAWRLTSCLALAIALVACIPLGGVPTATVVVPPSATHTVAAPSPTTAPPTATTVPVATDTAVPAATDTTEPGVTPTADPAREVILITEPGLVSSVSSPVRVAGEADSTFEQHLVIEITGEDGAVLATTPTIIQSELGTRGPFSADVDFSVTADQPGRISVFSTSARDGGLVHLASVEVTLLASGAAVINPAAPHSEVHQIFEPALLATVTGGQVHVEGFSQYVFEANINLALCGEGGTGAPDPICGTVDNVLATGFATMQAPDIGQPGPYETDLPYRVTASTRARLAVYSLSARDGGILHLSSVEITVEPSEIPEAIYILQPGRGSSVASPVTVSGEAERTFEQNLVVQITDQFGAVLATVPTTIQAGAPDRGPFAVDVEFTVTEDQPGRVSVYSTSARDGGLLHLASVEVDLLNGPGLVEGPEPHDEVHIIFEPAPLAEISGGAIQISGYSEAVFESTLVVALCGEGGVGAPELVCGTADNMLANGIAMVASPDVGQPGPFSAVLTYTITSPVQARLAIYSTSARDGGILHLASVPINLSP